MVVPCAILGVVEHHVSFQPALWPFIRAGGEAVRGTLLSFQLLLLKTQPFKQQSFFLTCNSLAKEDVGVAA